MCVGGGAEWCSDIWAGTLSMRECGRFMAKIDDLWLDGCIEVRPSLLHGPSSPSLSPQAT